MITLRETIPSDRSGILEMASAEPLFTPEEAATVAELLQDWLEDADHNGYYFLSAVEDDNVIGFACYGPTPLTAGTYTVYWLCVSPRGRRKGTGRALMHQVEQQARALGGRLLVLDTSGRPEYASTRVFYERIGYLRTAVVPDFYAPGDDLVMYTFPLTPIVWMTAPQPARPELAGAESGV
jgi:GNAT superfamily N-acetyltransferase